MLPRLRFHSVAQASLIAPLFMCRVGEIILHASSSAQFLDGHESFFFIFSRVLSKSRFLHCQPHHSSSIIQLAYIDAHRSVTVCLARKTSQREDFVIFYFHLYDMCNVVACQLVPSRWLLSLYFTLTTSLQVRDLFW